LTNQRTCCKTHCHGYFIVFQFSFIASEKQTNEPVEIEKQSPEELDSYLRKFLLAIRKKDGDEFEPTTLRGFLSSQYPKGRVFDSHRGQANFSACPVWMHTLINITNIVYKIVSLYATGGFMVNFRFEIQIIGIKKCSFGCMTNS
jgi:hypothetical protein